MSSLSLSLSHTHTHTHTHMQTWGGAQNGFGLAHCCQNVTLDSFPETATSVYFEYQPVSVSLTPHSKSTSTH